MPFREPTADEIREFLLRKSDRRSTNTEGLRSYVRRVYGKGADELDTEQKIGVARRLRRGGIATSVIACVLHMETVKTTVDRWVDDCNPGTSIGIDGKIRRTYKRRKALPPPGPDGPDLTVEPPSYESITRALLELRRAKVPVHRRPDYLRQYRGIEAGLPDEEIRRAARATRQCGFSLSVVSAIVGVHRATVHRWVSDITLGVEVDIRGIDQSDGEVAQVFEWDAPQISSK